MHRSSVTGRQRFRPALALVVGCLASLALAPGAEASATGSIAGTVKHASVGVEGIGVTVYEAEGEFVETVKTTAGGVYELPSLPEGSYEVYFAPNREDGYVSQYYDDKPSYESAQLVRVEAGRTTSAIDAELRIGGKIKGRVTDSSGNVEGGRVEASGTNAAHEYVYGGSAVTGANGEYTLEGLAEGEYRVSFEGAFGVNLVPQYFEDARSESEAKLVKVKEEESGPGQEANAKLEVGGEIAGTVTDAVTHTPLAGILVEAYNARGGLSRYGETNSNGEYSIVGLEGGGTYDLSFFEEAEFFEEETGLYIEQTDEGIGVTKEATTSVNAALVPDAPNDVVAPAISGTPLVGHALSCSAGSWIGVAPFKYAYRWLRDGGAIGAATGASYVVQAADQGHALSCEVTATNASGRGAALSSALHVAPAPVGSAPPPRPPAPEVALASSYKLVVHGRSARISLSCKAAPCLGAIELSEQVAVKHRKGRRTISERKKVVLAAGSYSLAAGQHGTFVLHFTSAGKRMLEHARHHRVGAALVVTDVGGLPAKGAVLLKLA
jgi:Carboxypeptidase regulatory-like domain